MVSEKEINRNLPAGATPLDSEDLSELIPEFITTRSELNDAEFKNITEVSNRYFLSRRKFIFSYENLLKLHKEMFGKVWKWAGKRRGLEKNIGVGSFNIDMELKKLLDDLDFWMNNSMEPLEIVSRLHHRLVYIHPFNNGNGRWARFLVNLFLKDNYNQFLKFPEDKLKVANNIRKTYIEALQYADNNNFEPFIHFHKKYIDDVFVK